MLGRSEGGQGPRTLDRAHQLKRVGRDPQDRAEGEQASVRVDDHGPVEAGDRLEHGRLEVAQRGAADGVMKGPLGVPGREVFGILRIVCGNLLGDPVIRSDQLTDRASRIANHH